MPYVATVSDVAKVPLVAVLCVSILSYVAAFSCVADVLYVAVVSCVAAMC